MAINKVELNNADGTKNTLIDLTQDTVTSSALAKGYKAHGSDGEEVIGALEVKPVEVYEDEQGNVVVDGASVELDGDDNVIVGTDTCPHKEYWFGTFNKGAEIFYNYEYNLNLSTDTSFDSITATTSQQSILASVSNKYISPSLDFNNYDYIATIEAIIPFEYKEDMTGKARMDVFCTSYVYCLSHRLSITAYTNEAVAVASRIWGYYITEANGVTSIQSSYGVYPTISAPTFSSESSATPSLRFAQPAIYVRANSTYTPVSNYDYIDSINTNMKCRYVIYRIQKSENYYLLQTRNRVTDMCLSRDLLSANV